LPEFADFAGQGEKPKFPAIAITAAKSLPYQAQTDQVRCFSATATWHAYIAKTIRLVRI
jgi:hypothetical protein